MKRPNSLAISRLLIVPVAIACALTACHSGNDDDSAAAAELLEQALAPQDVRLIAPELREEHATLQLVGEIRTFDTVVVAAEVGGTIDRVLAEVGDRVQTGDPLVEIDRETHRLRLRQAEAERAAAAAELDLTGKELERKRDLRSDDTIPQAVLDQAQAAQALAQARFEAATATRDLAARDHERSVARAPAGGSISARHTVAGEWVDTGYALLDLAVGGQVKVVARVPEAWVANLRGLETFEFTVGAASTTHTARLYAVEPVIEQASRSFEVIGTARVEDDAVRPGRFANVSLTAPEPVQTLWLPATAVATSDLPQVFLVEDGRIVDRKVQAGRRDNGNIEIVSGLAADEHVIAEVSGLQRGIPVTIIGN